MGWLTRLRESIRIRMWVVVILPTTMVFLITALILRWLVRQEIIEHFSDGTVPPEQVFDQIFGGQYIFWGAIAATMVSSLITGWLMERGARPLYDVARAAQELARGNYAVRLVIHSLQTNMIKSLANSLNTLAASLERMERLRRDLVANLAHEIRTPLTNLQGYLEALRDGVIAPNQEALDSVHEEVLRLVRLVDALHQLARADALRHHPPEFQLTNLDRLVEQLMEVIRPTMESKRLRFYVDLGTRGRRVPVHADSIAQVLRNLLRNAAHYTPEGGEIRIQTSAVADRFIFQCINTGPGIAAEDLPLLFQRFFRTERARQTGFGGVGLGLAIARELVEAHGGRMGAESKAGWTNFWFELPLESPGPRPPA